MTKDVLAKVIAMFKSEWAHSYGEARVMILWDAWKHLPDEVILNAAKEILYRHSGGAPTGAQMESYIEKERLRYNEKKYAHMDKQVSETLEAAPPDSPVALECQRQIREILEGKKVTAEIDPAEEQKRRDALRAQARGMDWKEKQAGEREDA